MFNKDHSEYSGPIRLYKNTKYNHYLPATQEMFDHYDSLSEYIVIGESQTIQIDCVSDTRQQEIEILEQDIRDGKIGHQVWLDQMRGKIQSLRAIEAC